METSRMEIEGKLFRALTEFRKNDVFLLENDVHEQSITHRFALYLQNEFPLLKVDCEYNRYGLFDINEVSRSVKRSRPEKKGKSGAPIRPDIVVHKRGDNSNNVLVIEAKKRKKQGGIPKKDKETLSWLTEPSFEDDSDRGYAFGLFMVFIGSNKLELTWFIDGEMQQPVKLSLKSEELNSLCYEQVFLRSHIKD